jgi:ketosteroid isomerase-like protein
MTPTEPHFDQDAGEMSSNDPDELPEVITSYLKAHQSRDLDGAIERYTDDASVTDEGRTYKGRTRSERGCPGRRASSATRSR